MRLKLSEFEIYRALVRGVVCPMRAVRASELMPDACDMHSVIACWHEGDSHEVARRLDWDLALAAMDSMMRDIVRGAAEGVATNELAMRYQATAPRICQVRETAGERIKSAWGGDPIEDAGREAGWAKHVRTHAQRRACRAERAAAWNGR